MSAEVWAILGLAVIVWATGERVSAHIDKLKEATRRPTELNGDDKMIDALNRIESELVKLREHLGDERL